MRPLARKEPGEPQLDPDGRRDGQRRPTPAFEEAECHLAEEQDVPPVRVGPESGPDRAIGLVGVGRDDEVGPRRVVVVKEADPADRHPVHHRRLAHQRRDGRDPPVFAGDDDVERRVPAKAIPPRPHPFVAQERMGDACAIDGVVPGALQAHEVAVVANDFHRTGGGDRQCFGRNHAS